MKLTPPIVRFAVVICALAALNTAVAASTTITWKPPTQNTDGSALTDLAQYGIFWGCQQSGNYQNSAVIPAPATEYTVTGLPDVGTCYFAGTSINAKGIQSAFSNETSKAMHGKPEQVSNLVVTWKAGAPLMGVSYLGTASDAKSSASSTTLDVTHTVPAGTKLLLFAIGWRDGVNRSISTVEDWDSGQSFVLISGAQTNPVSSGNDQYIEVWGLLNPTAQANTITVTLSGAVTYMWQYMLNFSGNVDSSLAAAISVLEVVDNLSTGETASTAFASAGTAGNALVAVGSFRGDDGNPASIDASFVEVIDGLTGGGSNHNADCSYYGAYLLDGAPAAPAISWSAAADPNAGIYLEIVAASVGTTVAIGQVIEADLSQAFSKAKNKAVSQISETDVAQASSSGKSRTTGIVAEADISQPFSKRKSKGMGLVSESDQVFAFTAVGAINVAIGVITESDSTQSLARAKQQAIALLGETDLAQAIGVDKTTAISMLTELDTAQSIGKAKQAGINLLSEVDQIFALTMTGTIGVALGLVSEADATQSLSKAKQRAIGLLTESDSSNAIAGNKATAIGIASESESLFAFGTAKAGSLGLLSSLESPLVMSVDRAQAIGVVTESDIAFATSVAKAMDLGLLSESDTVFAITATGPAVAQIAAARVVVEARGRHFVLEKRNSLVIVNAQSRPAEADEHDRTITVAARDGRIDVKKLH